MVGLFGGPTGLAARVFASLQ